MLACVNSSNFVCILERLLALIFHICGFALQNGEEHGFREHVEDVRKRLLNSSCPLITLSLSTFSSNF